VAVFPLHFHFGRFARVRFAEEFINDNAAALIAFDNAFRVPTTA
jgi:hypothetical protein